MQMWWRSRRNLWNTSRSYDKNSEVVGLLIKELKDKERGGYEYEAAEASFDLLMRRALGRYRPLLELRNYHLETYKTGNTPSKTVGRIFINSEGLDVMGAAVGVGPVETLDHAIRDALGPHFAYLKNVTLIDYRVRVLNPEEHSAAKVRVFITSTDGADIWETVGVHENIVEASWEALVESLEYYYNNYVVENGNGA
ncbi:MAG: hypothetical protein LC641_02140 [Spirochaeta sp.]|nr:hypothetical protein [Spirochaeta sp.]